MKTKPTKKQQPELLFSQDKINWQAETLRIIEHIKTHNIKVVYFDMFCGAGGLSKGVEDARLISGEKFAFVAVGINHDKLAIASHMINFPETIHLEEDIRVVNLEPLAKLAAAIRAAFPNIKIKGWFSAECTHHSKAKGGDSRDADSRSLPEEIERYEKAIGFDLIQVENVTEFRSWGPLEHKITAITDPAKYHHKIKSEFGLLVSTNKKVWIDPNTGFTYKIIRGGEIRPWMVPKKSEKGSYFSKWVDSIKYLGFKYEDRDINAADFGAITYRIRYYGQFAKNMAIKWPTQTHAKNPDKHFIKTGIMLPKHRAVRPVLNFSEKGDSIFVPKRIKSNQTFKRLTEGGIKFIAGGKKLYTERLENYKSMLVHFFDQQHSGYDKNMAAKYEQSNSNDSSPGFLIKYNSATPKDDNWKHTVIGYDSPCSTIPTRNMIANVQPIFLNEHEAESVIPFICQFNNNCAANSIDEPSKTLTQKEKFSLAFIQQANNGWEPSSLNVSTDQPSRTITSSGSQYLVQIEEILPFLSNYHGNGHNCHSIEDPATAVCAADIHALIHPVPFIFRQYGKNGGGHLQNIENPAGTVLSAPKMNIVSPELFVSSDATFLNHPPNSNMDAETCSSTCKEKPNAYILNPQYASKGSSIDKPAPVVIARQDKSPLHLAQVEYANNELMFGIVIYKTDSAEIRELKYLMAIYGIVDIKMRMLMEAELLQIQGFDKEFFTRVRLMGIRISSTAAKKYIGNSQEVTLASKLCEAYG